MIITQLNAMPSLKLCSYCSHMFGVLLVWFGLSNRVVCRSAYQLSEDHYSSDFCPVLLALSATLHCHPAVSLSVALPWGRLYRSAKCTTTRFAESFFPSAIRRLNKTVNDGVVNVEAVLCVSFMHFLTLKKSFMHMHFITALLWRYLCTGTLISALLYCANYPWAGLIIGPIHAWQLHCLFFFFYPVFYSVLLLFFVCLFFFIYFWGLFQPLFVW